MIGPRKKTACRQTAKQHFVYYNIKVRDFKPSKLYLVQNMEEINFEHLLARPYSILSRLNVTLEKESLKSS